MDQHVLDRVARAQAGLVSLRQLISSGLTQSRVKTMVRRGELRRILRGVYMVHRFMAPGPDGLRSRAAWAGLLAVEPHGISTGQCALHLHRVQGLPPRLTPEVAVPMGRSGRGPREVRVRRFPEPFETVLISGRQVAAPMPALVQALPQMDVDRAVAVLDSALNQRLICAESIALVRGGLRGRRGVVALSPCWELVDGRAASPVETSVRLECVRAGLVPTGLQVVLRGKNGGFVARGDLGWERADGTWVLVEVDGVEVHSRPEALFHDRSRQNQIMLTGRHTTLRFTARDLGMGRIPAQVSRALRI